MLPSMLLDAAVSAAAEYGSMLRWQHCRRLSMEACCNGSTVTVPFQLMQAHTGLLSHQESDFEAS